jgi:SnoaL-like domain
MTKKRVCGFATFLFSALAFSHPLAAETSLQREAQDRAQIQKLMWQYVRALDTENADEYAAVYTPDGQFGTGARFWAGMRRTCCGSRPRGVPDEFRIGREIRGLAERARTADDEYEGYLTTVNIGTVGTFSVTVRNTASGLSPTASPLASLRGLPR